MRRLIVVRHGQCTLNAQRRATGWSLDAPLTEMGHHQAGDAAHRVVEMVEHPVRVVASDALRAVQTATRIAEELGVGIETTDLAREQFLGDMEGLRFSEMTPMGVPEGADISEISWSGSETVAGVHTRMGELLAWLEATTPEGADVVLVGHGDALRVLHAVVTGRSHRDLDWEFTLANGEVRVLV